MSVRQAKFNSLRNEKGLSKVFGLFLVVFLAVFGLLGLPVIQFYYTYEELRGLFHFQAKTADTRSNKKIRRILSKEIKAKGIDVDIEEDLKLERGEEEMRIRLSWEEVLALDFGEDYYWELHVFEFDIDEKSKIAKNSYN